MFKRWCEQGIRLQSERFASGGGSFSLKNQTNMNAP